MHNQEVVPRAVRNDPERHVKETVALENKTSRWWMEPVVCEQARKARLRIPDPMMTILRHGTLSGREARRFFRLLQGLLLTLFQVKLVFTLWSPWSSSPHHTSYVIVFVRERCWLAGLFKHPVRVLVRAQKSRRAGSVVVVVVLLPDEACKEARERLGRCEEEQRSICLEKNKAGFVE